MSERRSELVEQVQVLLYNEDKIHVRWDRPYLEWDELEEVVPAEHVTRLKRKLELQAERIIALVTAARDAEIREALLSDTTTLHAGDHLVNRLETMDFYEGVDGEIHSSVMVVHWDTEQSVARRVIEDALSHIGLHGDGTGGQG